MQQQPWTVPVPASQPVYTTPQPVYQAQPVVPRYPYPYQVQPQYQQPSQWPTQQPVTTTQQQVMPQYQPRYQPQYQYVPRPWGNITEQNSNRSATVTTESWPQGGYVSPWDVPVTGTVGGGVPAGQVPVTPYYGYVW